METSTFENLVPSLRGVALSVCASMGLDGEDVAQDVLLKLWEMRADLSRIRSLPALVRVMARNMAISEHRRSRPMIVGAPPETIVDEGHAPDELLEASEDNEWLTKRINNLPSTQHTILHLRQVEHKSAAEIASLLGIKENSVYQLLHRARRTLYNELKQRQGL